MKKFLPAFLLLIVFFVGCSKTLEPKKETQPDKQNQHNNAYSPDKGFIIEHRIGCELIDKSSGYITEEFNGIEGRNWTPISFLDNENFLYQTRGPMGGNGWLYKYNIKNKKSDKLFALDGYVQLFNIQDSENFTISDDIRMLTVKNSNIERQVLFQDWKKQHSKYESYDIVGNPDNEKIFIYSTTKKCILTDLNLENIIELPFKGVYRACWIDNNNLIMGTFDNVKDLSGSAIITYNIQDKSTTKTYLSNKEVFVDPYRMNDNYGSFTPISDNTFVSGNIGIMDFKNNKVIFLKLDNIVDQELKLDYKWVLAINIKKPVDFKLWYGTTDGLVRLCVYDINEGTYIIRDNEIARPNGGAIISPDGKTIIYMAMDAIYINYKK